MKLNHLIIIGALCGALLLPSSASSWGVVGLYAGGATCETLKESQTSRFTDNNLGGSSTAYAASTFIASDNYTLCAVAVNLYQVGSPTGTLTCYIYSDDAENHTPVNLGEEGGPLATSTNTIESENLIGTSYDATNGWVTFNFAGVELTSTTQYWVVLYCSTYDASNYVKWPFYNAATGNYTAYDIDAKSWTAQTASRQGLLKTYSQ